MDEDMEGLEDTLELAENEELLGDSLFFGGESGVPCRIIGRRSAR